MPSLLQKEYSSSLPCTQILYYHFTPMLRGYNMLAYESWWNLKEHISPCEVNNIPLLQNSYIQCMNMCFFLAFSKLWGKKIDKDLQRIVHNYHLCETPSSQDGYHLHKWLQITITPNFATLYPSYICQWVHAIQILTSKWPPLWNEMEKI